MKEAFSTPDGSIKQNDIKQPLGKLINLLSNEKASIIISAVILAAGYAFGFVFNYEGFIFGYSISVSEILGSTLFLASWLCFAVLCTPKNKAVNIVMLVAWVFILLEAVIYPFFSYLPNDINPVINAAVLVSLFVLLSPLYGTTANLEAPFTLTIAVIVALAFITIAAVNLRENKKLAPPKKHDTKHTAPQSP